MEDSSALSELRYLVQKSELIFKIKSGLAVAWAGFCCREMAFYFFKTFIRASFPPCILTRRM